MSSSIKSVDASLWWDPFSSLLTELENASIASSSSSSDLPPELELKLKDNHDWLVETLSLFRPPNEKSKEALSSERVKLGSHELTIKPDLKDQALQMSSYLCLDEVQSYILVERSLEQNDEAVDSMAQDFVHAVLLQYYIERQCLLKCSRHILMDAVYNESSSAKQNNISAEAQKLIADGLENNLISALIDLFQSTHPEKMDLDSCTLWAEETLIEANLILDFIFLLYYESSCSCNKEKWENFCLLYQGLFSGGYNFGKLAISTEAVRSSYYAKVQLLLILIETLDLEKLLQMVHDETPFSQGAFVFSPSDIQEMDAIVSSFNALEMKEAGSLLLTWAVFLCLVSSLLGKEENNVLTEIDHVGYARQAFEAASLNCFLEILQSDILKESDGPVAGYRSVLRTFISAFIASYEINLQSEGTMVNLILDILCKIYQGEESLCVQFWDRESFIDGPIRCLLCNLESEFPFKTAEFVRFLSSLCEGSWPAECVYNFLDKSVGISCLFEISSESLVDSSGQTVVTRLPLNVPGVDGLFIPSGTHGRIVKVIEQSTALVRWEHAQSALLVLLLQLAQELYPDSCEEVLHTLELLSRIVSFNKVFVFFLLRFKFEYGISKSSHLWLANGCGPVPLCFSFKNVGNTLHCQTSGCNDEMEKNIWVVEILCTLVKKLSPNSCSAAIMAFGVNILTEMMKCFPSAVAAVVLRENIFDAAPNTMISDVAYSGSSSGSWLLSGRLARMLLIDCEHNDHECPLTLSVLDFTAQLVKMGLEDDFVLSLVIFSLQYILVNHEHWQYKVKHLRWKVTLKVLEVMKICIMSTPHLVKNQEIIRDLLLTDSSIHCSLFRIICTTRQTFEKLYISRLFEPMEIEGLQLALVSALDILFIMLSKLSKDVSSGLPILHQAVLSSTTKPVPVFVAVASFVSYFRDSAIQVAAAKVLSMLLTIADFSQPYSFGNGCFGLDDKQIADLGRSINCILLERSVWNESLLVAVFHLLTSAASYQPAFVFALFASKESAETQQINGASENQPEIGASLESSMSKKPKLVDAVLDHIKKSNELINSNPSTLFHVLNFLKSLWQGAGQYADILRWLKSSENFWKYLSKTISLEDGLPPNMTQKETLHLANKYQCQSVVLEIMAYDMFLKKKLLHSESVVKQGSEPKEKIQGAENTGKLKIAENYDAEDTLSNWCEGSVLTTLIESYISSGHDNKTISQAKVAASLFAVLAMRKLECGKAGSLSVSLVQNIQVLYKALCNQSAFSELFAQYSQRGYSEGKELKALILDDLYYHLEGELNGRVIGRGPFKELCQYLVESKLLRTLEHKFDQDPFAIAKDACVYDIKHVQEDLQLDLWDYSDWKGSKATAETMLQYMQNVNAISLLSNGKLSSLKALMDALTVYGNGVSILLSPRFFRYPASATHICFWLQMGDIKTNGRKIPHQTILPCVDDLCESLQSIVGSLTVVSDASKEDLKFLSVQSELLLHLMRCVSKSLSVPACVLVLKTSGSILKVLSDLGSSLVGVKSTVRLLLLLILLALEFSTSVDSGVRDMGFTEDVSELSNVSLSLLPVLCKCITVSECSTLSLTAVDFILRNIFTPNTSFPIIQSHLSLQPVLLKLQDKNSPSSIPVVLKFLLTLASVKGGAAMLVNAGFFSSLKVLFADLLDGPLMDNDKSFPIQSVKSEKPQQIWGLGLAVVSAVVHSLGDSSSYQYIVDNAILYFFSDKAYLISHYLNAPDFPSDVHDKKRPRAQRTQTSLTALKETENTLVLMCSLAKYWSSWIKAMKDVDSQLREKSIHLLSFISRGSHRPGEFSSKTAPLSCPPISKEEFDHDKESSFVNSKNGWFALSPHCCISKYKFSTAAPSKALVLKEQASRTCDSISQTYFSDLVAIQIYRIALLLLKFLCLQAAGAAKRAEEVGFVDLAHFPELPMPEILHGLQDQSAVIVAELCEANKSKQMDAEVQDVCLLLLQIMEMALYLELCVLQMCGIRPALSRVEDFSKEAKLLMKGKSTINLGWR
ncbi:uncharacterized protein [Rutidosis leptorrhynchoides]|uniref:uncharacterized protein n=1 Tax=Rutidosis leptorrhynchoides TaxID=125765 RepID=UPI003A993AF5